MNNSTDVDYTFAMLDFFLQTIAVGIFPSIFIIYYLELKLRKKNLLLSDKVNKQLEVKSADEFKTKELSFASHNSSVNITLDEFLCIKSMGNYVTLYFLKERQLRKEIIRITMKKIEDDFLDIKKIIRCHKSYYVNLNKVTTTSGNVRSLYLHINELDFQIPVSRNFSKEILTIKYFPCHYDK